MQKTQMKRDIMENNHLTAIINTDAIKHNIAFLQKRVQNRSRFCAVIKANAYGHGLECVIDAVKQANAQMLAVATIDEAIKLRQIEKTLPILIFGAEMNIYDEHQQRRLAEWLVENNVRITITRQREMKLIADAGQSLGRPGLVHIKIDTGMGRMGIEENAAQALLQNAANIKGVSIEGIYTHFANAGDQDHTFAYEQLGRFSRFMNTIQWLGFSVRLVHIANSAALLNLDGIGFDMIRPGLAIYGYCGSCPNAKRPNLKPALKLQSRITLVKAIPAGSYVGYGCTFQAKKDMAIGIVPIGYADGYSRKLSNCGKMQLFGKTVNVLGRVSMDQTIIDLTDFFKTGKTIEPGQEVTVISDNPADPNSVEAIAKQLQTIPNEIVTSLGTRIKRITAKANHHH